MLVLLLVVGYFSYKYLYKGGVLVGGDTSLATIKTRGKLIVASDIPYGPMEFFDKNGKPSGIDVDIAQEIAKSLGVKLEFLDEDFDNLFGRVKSGSVDLVLSAITLTEERKKEVLFSTPYFAGGQVILTNASENSISKMSDLVGKKVGVQANTTGHDLAKKYVDGSSIFAYKDVVEMVEAIKSKKVDVLVLDFIASVDVLKESRGLKAVGEPASEEFYGIVAKIGNNDLINKVNLILRELKRSGKMDQIEQKYTKVND